MFNRFTIIALLAFCLGAGVFMHTLFYSDSWQHRQVARRDLEGLKNNNDATEKTLARLKSETKALRQRADVQERTARHELGFIAPGEIVLHVDPNP